MMIKALWQLWEDTAYQDYGCDGIRESGFAPLLPNRIARFIRGLCLLIRSSAR